MPELSIALIQEASRGNHRAVRDVVDLLLPMLHYPVARALLRRRRRPPARDLRRETEDLIQSVLIFFINDGARALLRWDPARGGSLPGYIGLLAEREAGAILRSRRRSRRTEEPAAAGEAPAPIQLFPAAAGVRDGRDALSSLLDRVESVLNELDLELFHLIVIEERSMQDICTLMAMTPEAVYTARTRLARLARSIAVRLVAEGTPVGHRPITGHG